MRNLNNKPSKKCQVKLVIQDFRTLILSLCLPKIKGIKSNCVLTEIQNAKVVKSGLNKKTQKKLFQRYENNFTLIKGLEFK